MFSRIAKLAMVVYGAWILTASVSYADLKDSSIMTIGWHSKAYLSDSITIPAGTAEVLHTFKLLTGTGFVLSCKILVNPIGQAQTLSAGTYLISRPEKAPHPESNSGISMYRVNFIHEPGPLKKFDRFTLECSLFPPASVNSLAIIDPTIRQVEGVMNGLITFDPSVK